MRFAFVGGADVPDWVRPRAAACLVTRRRGHPRAPPLHRIRVDPKHMPSCVSLYLPFHSFSRRFLLCRASQQ
jgi:hypothetical protein